MRCHAQMRNSRRRRFPPPPICLKVARRPTALSRVRRVSKKVGSRLEKAWHAGTGLEGRAFTTLILNRHRLSFLPAVMPQLPLARHVSSTTPALSASSAMLMRPQHRRSRVIARYGMSPQKLPCPPHPSTEKVGIRFRGGHAPSMSRQHICLLRELATAHLREVEAGRE